MLSVATTTKTTTDDDDDDDDDNNKGVSLTCPVTLGAVKRQPCRPARPVQVIVKVAVGHSLFASRV